MFKLKGKTVIIGSVVGGMLLVLTACGSKPMQLKWTEMILAPRKVTEKLTDTRPKYFQSATCDKVKYNFDKESFDEKQATAFVERESELIDYADKIFGEKRDGREMILNKAVDGKRIGLEGGITYDALWAGLNRIHKAFGLEQYGLFYLYCVENELVKKEEIKEDTAIADYFSKEENQFLLDFCIPMIDSKIFEEEQAEMTKAAAKAFATWYVREHSLKDYEELCKNLETYDKTKLEKEKNAWLQSIGCKREYKESSKIFVKYSDCMYAEPPKTYDPADYEIEEEDVIWVWYSKDIRRIGWQEMVRKYKEYEPLRASDFAEAREFLKDYLPDKVEKAQLVCDYHHQRGVNGVTNPATMQIKTNRCWENTAGCLLHEYIHFLTLGENKLIDNSFSRFCVEGVAQWIASFELENQEYELCRPYMADAYNKEKVEGKTWEAGMLRFDKVYGDYEVFMDDLNDKAMRDSKRKPKSGVPYAVNIDSFFYPEWGCMLKYIYETYGMEKTFALLKSDADFENVLGKTVDELYFETADYVKEEMQKMEAAHE